jgi:feruloyl esterase
VAGICARASIVAALLLVAVAVRAGGIQERPEPDDCAVLAALDLGELAKEGVAIRAEPVPADADRPARCRVTGTIAPEIGVEIWLPADTWNGRLLVAGCYGLCGVIRAEQMEDAVARGYATATTDAGHSGQKYPDSRWAYNNTSLEEDFGHRAVHLTTRLAKSLAGAYYGKPAQYAYFRGCSTGGRQALVSASRHPDDFDGIIAGAPFDQALSVPHMIWADRANTGADGQPILGRRQFTLLRKAVLARCDAADGSIDSVVGDPEGCDFRPESLACASGQERDCLTPAQVEAAAKIYAGPTDGAGRRLAPFGAAPGSEFTWARQLLGKDGKPSFFHSIGQNWMQYHAFEPDPPLGSGPLVFDFDKDPPRLAAGLARVGYRPDLEAFAESDGKLIIYHGWSDESLQPAHTLAYWEAALKRNGGAEGLGSFARLYLLPGVLHCGGGTAAGDVDYLTALERWVEQGEAPDMLVAARTKASVPVTVRQPRFPLAGEILARRPIFPYPAVARFRGTGDPLDPASYERVLPGSAAATGTPLP